jgi:hypothetical protein
MTMGEDTIRKSIETLLEASREDNIEENAEKTKSMVVSRH